jgi:Ribbon-helix-helix protein
MGTVRRTARMNVVLRPDQKEAVERLARDADLTASQVTRRLLDLGLAHWQAATPTAVAP